jgi:uncharacterized protein YraI
MKKQKSGKNNNFNKRDTIPSPRYNRTKWNDIRKASTFREIWVDIPLTTRLYFLIIIGLVFLLLLLIWARSANKSLDLSLFGIFANGEITQAITEDASLAVKDGNLDGPAVIAIVNADIRSGPSVDYPSLGILNIGEAIELSGISPDGAWWSVRVPFVQSGQAWISATQVQAQNAQGVPVLPLPDELVAATRLASDPPMVTALINVNIRSGPGMDFNRVGLLQEGQEARAIGVDSEGFWYAIVVPGTENLQGWVSKDYIRIRYADLLPVIGSELSTPYLVPITLINVRAGPGSQYAIIGTLQRGEGAEVVGVSPDGEWWAIKFARGENGRGWVSSSYVQVENVEDVPVENQ